MRSVHDREGARSVCAATGLRDVVHAAARPLDVRTEDDARTVLRVELVERDAAHGRTAPRRDESPESQHAAVLVLAHQDLVAATELERARDGVERGARVRREDEASGVGADVGGEAQAGLLEALAESPLTAEELDRFALELALP